MSGDSEEIENMVSYPFGRVTLKEILTETKREGVEVRCDMVTHDTETLKKLASRGFKDQTLDATYILITGKEPAMRQFFYPFNLYQCNDTTVNKCNL